MTSLIVDELKELNGLMNDMVLIIQEIGESEDIPIDVSLDLDRINFDIQEKMATLSLFFINRESLENKFKAIRQFYSERILPFTKTWNEVREKEDD